MILRRGAKDNFHEIAVKAELATCESRDPRGNYKRARAGETPVFLAHRDTDPNYRPKNLKERLGDGGRDVDHYKQKKRGSNNIAIARKIIATEKRKQTCLLPLDPDSDLNTNEHQTIASLIGRYKRRAKKIVENVCEGNFP